MSMPMKKKSMWGGNGRGEGRILKRGEHRSEMNREERLSTGAETIMME